MKNFTTVQEKWQYLGKYFGYPQCCIDAFVASKGLSGATRMQQAAAEFGFVPCNTHAKEVMEEKVQLWQLIQNRECPAPFPFGN